MNISITETTKKQDLERIEKLIYVIRGQQVLLDRDIAMMYEIEVKRLNEQVRRNIERFPEDFMFQLTKEESELISLNKTKSITRSSRSQFATLNEQKNDTGKVTSSKRGLNLKYLPYAFTENGIAMLSSVLRTQSAIQVNISIMRAFTAMRHFITSNTQVHRRLVNLELQQAKFATHQAEIDHKLEEVFRKLDDEHIIKRQGVFFDGQVFDAYKLTCQMIKNAKTHIILFDNYIDETVLTLLDKRETGVTARIFTKTVNPQLRLDIKRHNAQYPPIEIRVFDRAHDRFLCIDEDVYHLGASVKDLGKKWFAFNHMELKTSELLSKL